MRSHSLHCLVTACAFAGTLAAAAPVLSVQPGTPKPGDPVLLTVRGATRPPKGTLGERHLRFYAIPDGFQALVALPLEEHPGLLEARVSVVDNPEEPARELIATLEVVPPNFRSSELHVANKFLNPPPEVKKHIEDDKVAFAKALNQPFTPPVFTRAFAWPRPLQITAPFGDLRLFNGKKQSQHYGTDLEGKTGDPIYAANDGTVVLARECYHSGNSVVVYHGAGLFTLYFHMSRILAKQGDTVHQGDRLGLVGKTGRVTGPHLHLGVKINTTYVDAETLMKLSFE